MVCDATVSSNSEHHSRLRNSVRLDDDAQGAVARAAAHVDGIGSAISAPRRRQTQLRHGTGNWHRSHQLNLHPGLFNNPSPGGDFSDSDRYRALDNAGRGDRALSTDSTFA